MRIFIKVMFTMVILALLISGCGKSASKKPPENSNKPPQQSSDTNEAPAGISIMPSYIHMIDENKGWALTDTAVYSTSDGGSKWTDVTPKMEKGITINSRTFIDANMGFFTTLEGEGRLVTVFRTTDGGKNWDTQTIESQDQLTAVKSLDFIDGKTGWMLVSYGAGAGSEYVGIYQTTDGGDSWKAVSEQNPSGSENNGLPGSGLKTGISFADGQKGWLTGLWYADTIYLFKTRDGGKTWEQQNVTAPEGYNTQAGAVETRPLIFFDDKNFLPVVFHQEGQPAIFYVTDDGGDTWIPTAPVKASKNEELVWSFPDEKHGFATDGSKIFVTADGCRTWSTGITPNADLNKVSQIDFVSPKTGWAVGENLFLKTTDGGKTWTSLGE